MRSHKIVRRDVSDQEQEQPSGARRALLTGGAVGLAAMAGATFGRVQPASAATVTVTEITPTGDNTGVGDTKAIVTAINALSDGGVVYLGPGEFYITFVTGYSNSTYDAVIYVPAQTSSGTAGGQGVSIQGSGSATVVNMLGGHTGFYCHRTSGYGAEYGLPAQNTTVFLRDFVVDGRNAAANAIGVDIGDGWGYDLDLTIVNFQAAGSIPLNIINRVFWTEKGRFRAQLMNNSVAAVLDTAIPSSDHSHEYNFYDFNIFCNEDQQGVVVQNGINNGGCILWLHGDMSLTSSSSGTPTNNVAALTITGNDGAGDNSRLYFSEIVMKVEGNSGIATGNTYPYGIFFGASGNAIKQCHGIITHSLTNSNLNSGEFSFRGEICDPGLSLTYTGTPGSGQTSISPPSVPPSGTAQQNYGPDQMVYVTGGTVSDITVNTVSTGQTSGGFFIPAGGIIKLTYSTTPSWTWVPAAYSAY